MPYASYWALLPSNRHCRYGKGMSQYDPVTPERLQQFLTRLGRECREPGRVYLVGGTGLLYQGLKALTKDVDKSTSLSLDAHDQFWRTVRRISRDMNMAIEDGSPGHFIPLPSGVEGRHRYLGRQGQLEVFAYDPVSTALAKIARGRVGDITDVLALVKAGQLALGTLAQDFDEILPRVEAGEALKIGADEYRQKMAGFLADAQAQELVDGSDTTDDIGRT